MKKLNDKKCPLVSIIVPVYNGTDFLSQAIDSALSQTYKNIELIVINDGSDDEGQTEKIALSYGDRIGYYKKDNGGVASALNMGIRKMSGEYFSWLSHDDLYTVDKISYQVEFIRKNYKKNSTKYIVYSDYYVFTDDPNKAIPVSMPGVDPENFRYWITVENSLHGCTLLIPKEAFYETGFFNEKLKTTQDYELWFRMAKSFSFVHLPQCLVKARSHPEQGSIKMSQLATTEINHLYIGFLSELTKNELSQLPHKIPSLDYGKIAAKMFNRGFYKAGLHATMLSIKNLHKSNIFTVSKVIYTIGIGLIKRFFLFIIRKLLPPNIRLQIKNQFMHKRNQILSEKNSKKEYNLKEKFTIVYENNTFGGDVSFSGEGSNFSQTSVIRNEIPKLLREFEIKTFTDAPCGDWYWMQRIDLPVERYIGIDIVDALIEKNQNTFGNDKISFQCLNLVEIDLPPTDLIFSRDFLVHLSFEDSLKIIANFKHSGAKYLLTTTFTDRYSNEDLGDGFWRPLNMQLSPFNFPEPVKLINEGCTEYNNQFNDKSLGLWLLKDING